MSNKDKINGAIVYDRDFEYDYFGFKTLERSYLMRCDGDIAERPQHMIMRVAIGIHGQDVRSRRLDVFWWLHYIQTTRLQERRSWVVSIPILSDFGHTGRRRHRNL